MKSVEDATVVGKSVTIRGELTGSEDLYLDGEFQGTVSLQQNRLTVGPNARIFADLHVRDLIVFGHIEGNIRASGRADLRQTAVVQGDILASRISIEEKASIKGRVEMASGDAGGTPSATHESAGDGAGVAGSLFGEPKGQFA